MHGNVTLLGNHDDKFPTHGDGRIKLDKNVNVTGHSTLGVNSGHVCQINAAVIIKSGSTVEFDGTFSYDDEADTTSASIFKVLKNATFEAALTAKRFETTETTTFKKAVTFGTSGEVPGSTAVFKRPATTQVGFDCNAATTINGGSVHLNPPRQSWTTMTGPLSLPQSLISSAARNDQTPPNP